MKKFLLTSSLSLLSFFLPAQNLTWQWAHSGGGNLFDQASDIAVDANNNSYVVGGFESASATFGFQTLTCAAADTLDVFIAKYDANGNLVWAMRAGGIREDAATCVTIDDAGNILVGGYYYSSSITFGMYTLMNPGGYSNGFVVKLSPGGGVLLTQHIIGQYDERINAIGTDTFNNLYVGGYFLADTLFINQDTLLCAGTYDGFLVKYDPSGIPQWGRSFGQAADERVTCLAVHPSGYVVAGGTFHAGPLIIGPDTLNYAGGAYSDIFVTKVTPGGNVLWARDEGGTYLDEPADLAIGMNGDVHMLASIYSSSLVFGSNTYSNSGTSFYCDVLLATYDSNGIPQWGDISGVSTGNDIGSKLCTSGSGDIFICGLHGPGIDFGGNILSGTGAFVVQYLNTGTVQWATTVDGVFARGIDLEGSIYVTVCGSLYAATATFGAHTINNAGSYDMFIAHMSDAMSVTGPEPTSSLSVFPNPAQGFFTLSGLTASGHQVAIINTLGQCVQRTTLLPGENTISISELERGSYFVVVDDQPAKKLIVQ